ncbi:putative inorganic phosphate cotransporter [Cylas formicarius]|uniref:putative inorganic phosphate cotransporter n=1 Tax=Cylas formicarius TaxID=197179 RepID=UPI002958C63F|nr:putative inorganic phosphate cotransporter [Cylas formicarius]
MNKTGENGRVEVEYTKVEQQKLETIDNKGKVPTIGVRHWQTLIFFALILIAFGIKVSISVAIVAMMDPTVSSSPSVPTYPQWDNKNVIMSAFFWGYIVPQPFAGWAADKWGPKRFLVGGMAVCSTLCVLVPATAAYFGSVGLMASRVIQGLSQGFIFPSTHHFLSQWVPVEERSRLGSSLYASALFGTVLAMLVTGFISGSTYGWPAVFYLYGSLGVGWCIIMAIFGYNSPSLHPTISQAEKLYIEKSLGHTDEKLTHKTPWKSIATSVPLWALLSSHVGDLFGFWTLLSQIPSYMKYVMNFNLKEDSFLMSLPYISFTLISGLFNFTSDFLISRKILPIGITRKIFNSIGLITPGVMLILLSYTKPDQPLRAVTLLVIGVTFNAATLCGWSINHMDLSPNHAGTMMGLTSGISNISGIIAPLVVQFLVDDERDPLQWRSVFLLASGVYIGAACIFMVFGSGEVQPWNQDSDDENEMESVEITAISKPE